MMIDLNNDTRKFCVACKFFVAPQDYDPDWYKTNNPSLGRCAKNDNRDKVTGERIYPSCRDERLRGGDCGPLAKFWTQREDKHAQELKDYDVKFMKKLWSWTRK